MGGGGGGGGGYTPGTKEVDKWILHEPGAQRFVYRLVYADNLIPVGRWEPSVAFTWRRAMEYKTTMFQSPTEFVRAGVLIYAVDSYSDE